MTERRDFYVYVIFRPNGIPCYVGKGWGKRWLKHEWRSTNPHLANIVKLAKGELPKIKIREWLTEREAFAIEIAFIAAIGRETNGGPLVNLTDGGEGISGHKMSAESLAKMSAASKGNKYCIGRKASPETKAKQRAAKLGRTLTPEHRAKIGVASRNTPRGPEWGARISMAKMGHEVAPETREKLRSWERTPELCAKIAAATKESMKRPEVQAKLEAHRKRMADENRQGS